MAHHPECVDDDRERIAQLVGEHRQEFVHLLLGFLHCLDPPASGQVARDFRESTQAMLAVVERGNDHVRPEAAPVLADAPALVLESALGAGDRELLLGPMPGEVLGRIEPGKVRTDDFGGCIALDALRCGVPAGDVPLGVEAEDRVILDAVDQKAKALLVLAQDLLVPGAFLELEAKGPVRLGKLPRPLFDALLEEFLAAPQLHDGAVTLANHRAQDESRYHQRAHIGKQEQQCNIGRGFAEGAAAVQRVPDGNRT